MTGDCHLYKIEFSQPNTSCIFIYSGLLIPQKKFKGSENFLLGVFLFLLLVWISFFPILFFNSLFFILEKSDFTYQLSNCHLPFVVSIKLDLSHHLKIIMLFFYQYFTSFVTKKHGDFLPFLCPGTVQLQNYLFLSNLTNSCVKLCVCICMYTYRWIILGDNCLNIFHNF